MLVKIGSSFPRDRDENEQIFELPPPRQKQLLGVGSDDISFGTQASLSLVDSARSGTNFRVTASETNFRPSASGKPSRICAERCGGLYVDSRHHGGLRPCGLDD